MSVIPTLFNQNNGMKIFNQEKLQEALELLNEQLILRESPETELIVCGGSALVAMELVSRTTQDVDIVALMQHNAPVTARYRFPVI